MTNKYVIKNCPILMGTHHCFGRYTQQCADRTDCLLVQVVEKCKKTLAQMDKDSGRNAYAGGRCIEAENILRLFEIEEIK